MATNKSNGVEPPDSLEKVRERRLSEASIVSRGKWGSKWEFLLSCIGLSVGIGNVWRFPYLALKNGGGAFLIPYLIMLFLVGKPLYFLELAFGQFAGVGPIAIWSCVPIAKGVGFAMVTVSLIICIYYNVIMSYCLYFLVSSFFPTLPWTECNPDWVMRENETCVLRSDNVTGLLNPDGSKNASFLFSSEAYFYRSVLDHSDGLSDVGGVKWDLALCLLLSWIIVCGCLVKGIKTSGKIVYFAATFPYVILLTLLVTGFLQDGALEGVLYFIKPQWEKLLEIQVWQAAAGQMFFSLSVSMGGLIMYSSYNDFRNNVFRDAMVVSVMDTLTSIISGMVIFSVLGALAKELGTTVDKVAEGGPGLAFIAYPDALSRLPIPQLFSVLFFIMLFILGLDSEFALLENVLTSISDEIEFLRRHKLKFCLGTGVFCYLIGLVFVTRGGLHILDIVDNYGGSLSVIFIAIAESIALCWVYGLNRLISDIKFMLGKDIGWYWKITWVVTSPIVLAFILVYSLATHKSIQSRGEPAWADVLAWIMTIVSVIQMPLWAAIMIYKQPDKGFKAKFYRSLKPSAAWGPANPETKLLWLAHNKMELNEVHTVSAITPSNGFALTDVSASSPSKPGYTNGSYTTYPEQEAGPPPPYKSTNGFNNHGFTE